MTTIQNLKNAHRYEKAVGRLTVLKEIFLELYYIKILG